MPGVEATAPGGPMDDPDELFARLPPEVKGQVLQMLERLVHLDEDIHPVPVRA